MLPVKTDPIITHRQRHDRSLAKLVVFLSFTALILLCVGIGTLQWYTYYDLTTGQLLNTISFFYNCYLSNSEWNCTSSQDLAASSDHSSWPSTDNYVRLRNAAALCIVGLIFVAFAALATLILLAAAKHIKAAHGKWNLICGLLFFVAALFQRAGLSEGQRQINYTGYSPILYVTGHAITILSVSITAFIAGRIYY